MRILSTDDKIREARAIASDGILEPLLRRCESPIERLFMCAVLQHPARTCIYAGRKKKNEFRYICEWEIKSRIILVAQQWHHGPSRFDFAFMQGEDGIYVDVELDGAEWHDADENQVMRDRQRDRALQVEGWRVFRFSGSEVYTDVNKCLGEVVGFIEFLATPPTFTPADPDVDGVF